MRDGTAPAVARGRELSGRRTTEQYILRSHLLAPPSWGGGMRSCLSWAGRRPDPQHDEYRASPYHPVMRARCRGRRAPRSCRQLFGDTRGEQLTILIQEKVQESEGQQQLANCLTWAVVTPDRAGAVQPTGADSPPHDLAAPWSAR